MSIVAEASATSTAPADAFFAKWADVATWPEWNTDIEWARLDGAFAEGVTGKVKTSSGPAAKYTITRLTSTEYVEVAAMPLASLSSAYTLGTNDAGLTTISVRIGMDGPLRWLWAKIMGAKLAKAAAPDLEKLVAAAEVDGAQENKS